MQLRIVYILLFLAVFSACKGQKSDSSENKQRTFEMITLPDTITQPEKRAIYLAMHYWDRFDFSDTVYIDLPKVTEQAFVDYLSVIQVIPKGAASSAIRGMMHKATVERSMFRHFAYLYEKYLYDLSSPLRDESLFIYALEAMIEEPVFDEIQKVRPLHLLELAHKNKVGDLATNIDFTLANEKKGSLYQVNADYLVLFFYQPDCHTCMEIKDQFVGSSVIQEWMKQKKVQVLAIYPGENLYVWKDNLSYMPADWIHAYDHTGTILGEEIYDLKTSSTLYLLDKKKKVLLKDTKIEQIEQFIKNVP